MNTPLHVHFNGQALLLEAPFSIADLLRAQGLAERRVAVECNGEIVPRGRHGSTWLADGDKVEVVHAIGGG